MSNKYVDFISDEHLFNCIQYLYEVYEEANRKFSKKKFYRNKVDPIRFNFDSIFFGIDLTTYLESSEVTRQIGKTVGKAIGDFHEMLIDGIEGYERGKFDGYDIKSLDNTVFAEVKNKHNTMNSSSKESTYQKLERLADKYVNAKCYYVQIIAKKSIHKKWYAEFDKTKDDVETRVYNHDRVYEISADKFYELLTNDKNAFYKLCKAIPQATKDFIKSKEVSGMTDNSSLIDLLEKKANDNGIDLLTQIMLDNFETYEGFKEARELLED